MNTCFKTTVHKCDLCVVGGGLAGMCAAIAAARHGLKVVIMQDRPMFGGNASSEIRMWVCGAHGSNNRETGIIEEIALENLYRNPYRIYPIWDSILFEIVKKEKNITILLNCTCNDCEMEDNSIKSVTGWQMTTQQFNTVEAKYFADCSGDSVLAPLTGALYRMGREAKGEFGESIAPPVEDKKTMGLSCLIQARETNEKHEFIPPVWANKYTKDDLPYRIPDMKCYGENFWYMELGGTKNTIDDAEEIRDDLLKVAYGIWDFVKNSGELDTDNWELEFVGFLPGKRESRRYVGDHVMTQNDVRSGGKFDDIVAYGGWTMDDHNPYGIETSEQPTIYHDAPSPFGIPYRSLYSKNIENLFFAGRNISVTHSALSSTRVMATCAILGQAIGTATYTAKKHNIHPRDIYPKYIRELQNTLIADDCYLPYTAMDIPEVLKTAKIVSAGMNSELLLNGYTRPIGENNNCWSGRPGDYIEIELANETYINEVSLIVDSDLNRETIGAGDYLKEKSTICNIPLKEKAVHVPETILKEVSVEIKNADGEYESAGGVFDNHQRLIHVPINQKCTAIKITAGSTWGSDIVRIFSLNVK